MRSRRIVILSSLALVVLAGAGVWGWSRWSLDQAVEALEAENPTDAQIELIAGLLADQTGKYRGRAERKLREVGGRAVPALTNLSRNGVAEVRITAAKLAAEIDPDGEGFAGLEIVLHDKNVTLRRAAANVLFSFVKGGRMADYEGSYKLLLSAVDDPDPVVREAVATGLGQLHTKQAEQALERLAQDENSDVAYAASRQLWQHGKGR